MTTMTAEETVIPESQLPMSTTSISNKMDVSARTSPTTSAHSQEEEEHDNHDDDEEEDYVPESLKAFIADADAALENFLVVPTPQKKGKYDDLPQTPHSDVISKYGDDFGVNPAYYVTAMEAKANGAYYGPGTPGRSSVKPKTVVLGNAGAGGGILDLNQELAQETIQEIEEVAVIVEQGEDGIEALVEKTAKMNIGSNHEDTSTTTPTKVINTTNDLVLQSPTTTQTAMTAEVESKQQVSKEEPQMPIAAQEEAAKEITIDIMTMDDEQISKLQKTAEALDLLALDDDLSIGTQLSDDLSMDNSDDDNDGEESFFPNEDSVPSTPVKNSPVKKPSPKVTKHVDPPSPPTPSPKVDRTVRVPFSKPKTRSFANSLSPQKKKLPLKKGRIRPTAARSEKEMKRQKRIELLKAARKLKVPLKSAKARTLTTPRGPKFLTRAKKGDRRHSITGPQADNQSTTCPIETDFKPARKNGRTGSRRLTIPVGPKLRTQAKNGERRYSVVHDSKTDKVKEAQQPHSPSRRTRSLTVPRAPKLQTQALHGDRCYSAVGKRVQEKTREETQSMASKSKKKRQLTVPVAPNLLSVSRRRVKPQVDKENISDNRTHIFKAAPIGPGVLSKTSNSKASGGVLGIPKVPKKTLTTPTPFRLRSNERSALKVANTKKDDDEGSKSSFRARPLPNMTKKPTSINISKKRLTNPKPFNLRSEERKGSHQATLSLSNSPLASPNSRKRRTLTEPKPFNLRMDKRIPFPPSPPKRSAASRVKEPATKRVSTKAIPFRLRTMRTGVAISKQENSVSNLPCPPKLTRKPVHKRELTTPRPFRLRTSERGHLNDTRTAQKAPSPKKLMKPERRQSTVPKPFRLSSNHKSQTQSSINSVAANRSRQSVSSNFPPVPPIMTARSRERELQMERTKRLVCAAEELSLLPASSDLSAHSSLPAKHPNLFKSNGQEETFLVPIE